MYSLRRAKIFIFLPPASNNPDNNPPFFNQNFAFLNRGINIMLLYFPKDKHPTPSNPPPGVHGTHALPESSCLAPCPPCISLARVQSTSRLLKPRFFLKLHTFLYTPRPEVYNFSCFYGTSKAFLDSLIFFFPPKMLSEN